jgi:L,D-transpeptidase YcbB
MKAKSILVSAIILIIVGVSCFDHNNLRQGKQSATVIDESQMTSMLVNTLINVNDSVNLAFRGKELSTGKLIKKFYGLNKNLPVWTSGMEPNHFARELMRLFTRAQYYGLDTSFYQYTELMQLYSSLSDHKGSDLDKKALEYELLMTHNCFKLMSNLHSGLLYADTSIYGFNLAKYPLNFSEKLWQFINDDKLSEGILDLQPKSYEYKRLQKGLEQFINHNKLSPDSFDIPDPAKDSALAYQKAKEILIAYNFLNPDLYVERQVQDLMGYYRQNGPNNELNRTSFSICADEDTLFFNALKEFQMEHGLSPDGKIGYNTKKALMMNNKERFEQIAINLERLRWEKNRPANYVYVNIPAYKLRVLESYNIVKTFNVVVGALATKTPLLNSKIEFFTTNPEWNVPYSILSKELLPKIKKDSTYLARHNMRIYDKNLDQVGQVDWSGIDIKNFDYSLKQASGSDNAMGKIKFYFKNPFNVFIHDTPEKSKFNKDIRAYSHGCMRLQNPNEFAIALLKVEQSNKADSVNIWIASGVRKVVNLPEPVPLYVRYVTCEADSKGKITFYQDIYGKDKILKEQFFAKNDF